MLGSAQDVVVPDLVEAVEGWRCWNVGTSYDRRILVSPTTRTPWPTTGPIEAWCTHDADKRSSCHCGINAWSRAELMPSSQYARCKVWGRVALWGEVHQLEIGWRGQHAKPIELFVSPDMDDAQNVAKELARHYRCQATVADQPLCDLPSEKPQLAPVPLSRWWKRCWLGSYIIFACAAVVMAVWTMQRGLSGQTVIPDGMLAVWMIGAMTPLLFGVALMMSMIGSNGGWIRGRHWAASMLRVQIMMLGPVLLAMGVMLGSNQLANLSTNADQQIKQVASTGTPRTIAAPSDRLEALAWAWSYRSREKCSNELPEGEKLGVRMCNKNGQVQLTRLTAKQTKAARAKDKDG